MHNLRLAGIVMGAFLILPLAVAVAIRFLGRALVVGQRIAGSWPEILLTCAVMTGIAMLAGAVYPAYAFLVGATCIAVMSTTSLMDWLRGKQKAAPTPSGAALAVPRPYLNETGISPRPAAALISEVPSRIAGVRIKSTRDVPLSKA